MDGDGGHEMVMDGDGGHEMVMAMWDMRYQ